MRSNMNYRDSAYRALRLFTLISTIGLAGLLSACSSSDTGSSGHNQDGATALADNNTEQSTVWTCSMHPQIRMPEFGACPICGMDLIPATATSDDSGERSVKLGENARRLASIQVTPVERHIVTREVRMVGLVEYDETSQRNINAWFPGRIDKLFVNFTGVTVKKGEPMAEIYSPELISAQEELLQAIESRDQLSASRIAVVRASAETTISAAKDKLRLWGITKNQIAELEETGVIRDHLTIHSPFDGVVITRNTSEGDYVKAGTRLFTIADLSTVWLSLDAYESDLNHLRVKQEVTFNTNTYPGEMFVGKITFIDPTLNLKSRTVRARVEVDNQDGRLKPGMFAHAIAYSDIEESGADIPLVIPASSPLITGKRAVVYVQDENDPSTFSGREVILGARSANMYVVREGLSEGDMVVTNGAFKIDAAMQIQAKPSMMYASGGAPSSGHDHGGMGDNSMQMSDSTTSRSSTKAPAESSIKQVSAPRDLNSTFENYFDLQEALRSDEFAAAKSAAGELVSVLKSFSSDSASTRGHATFDSLTNQALNASTSIVGSGNIDAARLQFQNLTSAITAFADNYGVGDNSAYQFFCPMAIGGKGALWLQRDSSLQNPYYGASMLKCGVLKRVIENTKPSDTKATSHEGQDHKDH